MIARFERGVNLILSTAALILIALVAWGRFAVNTVAGGQESPTPVYDSAWASLLDHAAWAGDPQAPVKILEFVDFQCPACGIIHMQTLEPLMARYGDRLAIGYIHTPLPQHAHARVAAQAAECAFNQGALGGFARAIFSDQASLGTRSWWDYALEGGVRDSLAYAECMLRPPPERIDSGLALAKAKGITGTPTFYVNGWLLPPTLHSDLDSVVAKAAAGYGLDQ